MAAKLKGAQNTILRGPQRPPTQCDLGPDQPDMSIYQPFEHNSPTNHTATLSALCMQIIIPTTVIMAL